MPDESKSGDTRDKGGDKGEQGKGGAPDSAKEIAELKSQVAELMKRLAPPKDEDPDLKEKARLEKEKADKSKGDSKALENALRFSLESPKFLEANEALLPKDIGDIFKLAEKENYSSAIEKDQAIKSGIIQSFFSVQANADLLTPGLKSQLDDYLKLTKNGKQDKAQQIYDSIFEPAFEMLKRLRKAEALSKGHGGEGDGESAYKTKLMNLSKKHYLGDK